MRVLHVLPSGGMGWAGGIRPTLRSLADSSLGQQHSFEVTGQDELKSTLASWAPELLVWHVAASWKALPRLLPRRRCRQILFEHHYCQGFEEHTVPSRRRFRAMLRLAYGCMERVVAVSSAQAAWMGAAGLVPPPRLRLICSSRPLDGFLSLPPPGAVPPGAPLRLLAYGRLTRQKGFDLLIRAMALLPQAPLQLRLVGDGEQRRELERLAGPDGRIELLGARNDIPELLSAADAVIIPSRWEPWGNVCLEARAAARPVIVSPVDGLPEQVDGCGLQAAAASAEGLAGALQQLLASTPEERAAWSRGARDSARGSWQAYLDGWQGLLAEPR
ncbi:MULTISPECIES: glycosyltransferase family 4 protein [Aphanothece]|uniref:glycosyltransferase family 4 protein n=1 Tax=Aphanothece TaxID=1121 RepID=UPI003985405A